ncbi:MJ0042-type zinc finger domain-containing protein [Rhodopseudomonas palustris]|uniref:MJ0042-type zinc finger domain-containing protein n=1 Tax=Rhodopseudomonas palustris TaxID=1076 RepID=UPI002ACD87FD|nr:MJ0042-type zinc finger domain-containing protein [Rhodopseudomonas palustris]WQG98255.1 MJ0042-type zinc finger domain-containing protein [Rhodopseudomonas palustris]
MHIVCPHCTTSYAIDPAKLGDTGRTVRCSRCKEVWLARPEDVIQSEARVAAMTAEDKQPTDDLAADAGWGLTDDDQDTPVVDSPPIAAELPTVEDRTTPEPEPDADADADAEVVPRAGRKRSKRSFGARRPKGLKALLEPLKQDPIGTIKSAFTASTACAAFGALALGLLIWRADVVRLLPQTGTFYRLVGFEVNLRSLAIKDVKISRETVESKPVLVIEGMIMGLGRKPADLPRLRFVVRDERGTEIYAWNAVLEQTVLRPGEQAWFRSRLASPPAEARSIDVRFFNRRDIMTGGA